MEGSGRMKKTRKESRSADRDDLSVGYCRADRILLNGCKYKKKFYRIQVGAW